MRAKQTQELQIASAEPTDASALFELEQRSFSSDRMALRQYQRHLRSKSAAVLVARTGAQIQGCAVIFFRDHLKQARLYSIAVDPAARGLGLGEQLLNAVLAQARARAESMRLEVRIDNRAAIRLYEKFGFKCLKLLPGYYQDGADGVRMVRELTQT